MLITLPDVRFTLALWNMTPCSLTDMYQNFNEIFCFHHQCIIIRRVQIFWKNIMPPYAQYINLCTGAACPSETLTFLYQSAVSHNLEMHNLNKVDYAAERSWVVELAEVVKLLWRDHFMKTIICSDGYLQKVIWKLCFKHDTQRRTLQEEARRTNYNTHAHPRDLLVSQQQQQRAAISPLVIF
jgi:hypothetical protein